MSNTKIELNLDNLDVSSVETFAVDNAMAIAEYAASCGGNCNAETSCSCVSKPPSPSDKPQF